MRVRAGRRTLCPSWRCTRPHPSPTTACPLRRVAMVRSLLAPYEQRPWAQTNWILVRLWRVSPAGGEVAVVGWRGGLPSPPLTPMDPRHRAVGSGTATHGCRTC